MGGVNLSDAFLRYRVKSSSRARSALAADGNLVLSCHYGGFKRAAPGILRYEEDLSGSEGATASLLRTHLAQALANESDVRLIIATPVRRPPALDPHEPPQADRMSFSTREDLVGRVTSFDGSRFVVEFRKITAAA